MDDSEEGIYVFQFSSPVTAEDVERSIAEYQRCLDRGDPYVVIVDVLAAGAPSGPLLVETGRWLRRNHAQIRRVLQGAAIVVDSPVIRTMVGSMMRLGRLDRTMFLTPDGARARDWGRERLAAAGQRSAV